MWFLCKSDSYYWNCVIVNLWNRQYVPYYWSNRGLKWAFVNQACTSIYRGLFKIYSSCNSWFGLNLKMPCLVEPVSAQSAGDIWRLRFRSLTLGSGRTSGSIIYSGYIRDGRSNFLMKSINPPLKKRWKWGIIAIKINCNSNVWNQSSIVSRTKLQSNKKKVNVFCIYVYLLEKSFSIPFLIFF